MPKGLGPLIDHISTPWTRIGLGRSREIKALIGELDASWSQYNQAGKIEDLENTILRAREALSHCTPGHRYRLDVVSKLAGGLHARYQRLRKMADLEEAILFHREVLTLCDAGKLDRAHLLNKLAIDLRTRYKQLGKMQDLEEAIASNREALTLRPPGHPDRPSSLNNLAVAVGNRYQQLGGMVDLEESMLLHREALTLRPPGHPDREKSLNNLAVGLRMRYQLLGKMDDLEEAIMFDREGLKHRPLGHPDRSSSLNNLAASLRSRYQELGKMEDLEEAIGFDREALTLCPLEHPRRSSSLSNLAGGLRMRYQQLGKMDDLEEAIAFQRESLALRPPGNSNRPISLNNLANGLIARYQQSGKTDDLDEAIVFHREALDLYPLGHPHRSRALNNLANGLLACFEQSGKIDDLDEAIVLDREALNLCPPGHPDRPNSLDNLARVLRTRSQRLDKIEDLEEAILFHREALALHPSGHPDRSKFLNNLANDISIRYEHLGKMADLQTMFSYYQESASDSTSSLRDRLTGAITWAKMAMQHHHHSTLDAYTTSLTLLSRSLVSRPDVKTQHGFLSTAAIPRSLASDAASAAIQAGKLELAVEFLEQGRAMLWSKINAYKYPLEQLRDSEVQGGGELADRLETLSNELEHLVLLSDRTGALEQDSLQQASSLDARIKRHRILSKEWESLVGKIREMPGFAHFLQTPSFDTFRLAAAEGPVILVNVSDYRSDAIVLTIDNPPILVPLSTVKTVDISDQIPQVKTKQGVVSVLRYLWANIASPVVACLTNLGVEKKSRIWWCPTAALCALPLHAAGPYRPREPGLPDLYTSSYISTLSSLIRARSDIQLSRSPKLLVIGQPHESLEKVGAEVGIIQRVDNVPIDVLLGAEATHEAVLISLKQHSWAHFACHGHLADKDQPFPSFELFDGHRLTLLELIQARLPNAESAFLAACHSAGGDSRTRDEHIHLSAALQFCGFRSVVGTLWEMFDEDGPMMSKEFYRYMFRDPAKVDFRDSAVALNFAVREMRKAKLPPERWAMFVHIGA